MTIAAKSYKDVVGANTILENMRERRARNELKVLTTAHVLDEAFRVAKGAYVDEAYAEVLAGVTEVYDTFVLTEGERPCNIKQPEAASEWDSALDDHVADFVEPYAKLLSNTWFLENTVDTRLGVDGEIERFAKDMAFEMWANATAGEDMTPNRILSAIGIALKEAEAFLHEPARATTPDTQEQPTETDMTTNAVLNRIMMALGGPANLGDFELVLADDTDDFILKQAMQRLGGIDEDDVETLRMAVMMGATAKQLHALVATGELLDEDSEDVGATDAPAAAEPPTEALPAPEAPPAPRKKSKAEQMADSAVPAEVLAAFKDNANIKDDDAATAVGVSRAQYNNFVKGKKPFAPDDAERAALRAIVVDRINNLINALAQYDGVPYDTIE